VTEKRKKAAKAATVVTSATLSSTTPGTKSEVQRGTERLHTGKIIKLDRDRIRYPDGSEAEVDIVRHPGASAVVPFLSDPEGEDPQILLLRQYRYAADGYLYEIEPLITMVTTPGFTDERIHLFMATELSHGEAAREADEFADVIIMRLSEALELIQRGEIVDGKTALGILYAAGFKTG
jgi:ADP-ribose pyrophosphatase